MSPLYLFCLSLYLYIFIFYISISLFLLSLLFYCFVIILLDNTPPGNSIIIVLLYSLPSALFFCYYLISFVFISLYNGVTLKITLNKCTLITSINTFALTIYTTLTSLPFCILSNLSSYCAPLNKNTGKKMLNPFINASPSSIYSFISISIPL